MDKETHSPTKTIFPRLEPAKHLKPLSMYSKMITSEQNASVHNQRKFSDPFINFKFEVINNCAKKRKSEDSCSDEGYETPAKQACSPKDLSPDLGCFMDYCSPPARQDPVSPFAISMPALLDETQAVSSEIKESVRSQLHSEHVEGGISTEPGLSKGTVPDSLRCDKDLLNPLPAFDCDVDDILCLSPLDKVEGRESQSGNTFQNNLGPIVSGPMLESHNPPVDHLEGEVEEVWNIGPPILESSMFQTTLGGEDTTLDNDYETTLPLDVKVKSVVVALMPHTSSNKSAASSLPASTAKPTKPDENRGSETAKCVSTARSQRPVVFDREVDWEREKRLYVHSVTRHMKEHEGANQGVMSELQTLMSHVADQTPGSVGGQWQHPSDLTRRNYQRRFGNVRPKMTLLEWQTTNCSTFKRFARIPKTFERSPFP